MKNSVFIIIMLFWGIQIVAQDAETYFKKAGSEYILKDSKTALQTIDQGLSVHPNNEKLTQLKERIKEQEEQKKKDQNQDSEAEDKDDSEKEKGDQQGEEQNKEDSKEGEQNEEGDQKPKDEQDQNGDGEDQKSNGDKSQQAGEAMDINSMSKKDAERLLEAVQREEAKTQQSLIKKESKKPKSKKVKDW